MFEPLTQRRYLIPFKASRLPQQITDVLVIGGGVAGLRAAIAAAEEGADVLLLTKDTIDQSNTWYAQGGIAAVLQPADSIESHVAGHARLRRGVVRSTRPCTSSSTRGRERVLELLSWGAHFDKTGRQAARSGLRPGRRPLASPGSSTPMAMRPGRNWPRRSSTPVKSRETIRISEMSFVIDLLTDEGQCVGVLALIKGRST